MNYEFYAVLNVPLNASNEQIRDSYKKLCKTYHPDKHPLEKRHEAQEMFSKIDRAYRVLSNERARIAYDALGKDCEEVSSQLESRELVSTQDIRRDFEDRVRFENLKKLELLVSQKTEATVCLDASFLERLKLQRFYFKYYTKVLDMPFFRVGLGGSINLENQRGVAGIKVLIRNTLSDKTTLKTSISLLNPQHLEQKLTHVLDKKTETILILDSNTSLSDPPVFSFTVSRKLIPNTGFNGFLRYSTGSYKLFSWGRGSLADRIKFASETNQELQISRDAVSSVTMGIQWSKENHVAVLSLENSILMREIVFFTKKPIQDLSLESTIRLNQGRLFSQWFLFTDLTEHTKMGFGASLNNDGSSLCFCIERLGQKLSIPIILFPVPEITSFGLVSCFVAGLTISGIKYLLYPLKLRKKQKEQQELNEKLKELLAQQKKQAMDSKGLMESHVFEKINLEKEINGLVILQATYGLIDRIDVTIPVMSLVHDSKLSIAGGISKSQLLGFYNVSSNSNLEIHYEFRKELHYAKFEDTQSVTLPMRSTSYLTRSSQIALLCRIISSNRSFCCCFCFKSLDHNMLGIHPIECACSSFRILYLIIRKSINMVPAATINVFLFQFLVCVHGPPVGL